MINFTYYVSILFIKKMMKRGYPAISYPWIRKKFIKLASYIPFAQNMWTTCY